LPLQFPYYLIMARFQIKTSNIWKRKKIGSRDELMDYQWNMEQMLATGIKNHLKDMVEILTNDKIT